MCTLFQGVNPIVDGSVTCQDDDWKVFSQSTTQSEKFQPVHLGHLHIADHEIEMTRSVEEVDGLFPALGDDHIKADKHEKISKRFGDLRIVINHQDPGPQFLKVGLLDHTRNYSLKTGWSLRFVGLYLLHHFASLILVEKPLFRKGLD